MEDRPRPPAPADRGNPGGRRPPHRHQTVSPPARERRGGNRPPARTGRARIGAVGPPAWVADGEFDLDYHLRHVALAGGGSSPELQETVSRWYEDPFDPAGLSGSSSSSMGSKGVRGPCSPSCTTPSATASACCASRSATSTSNGSAAGGPVDLDRIVSDAGGRPPGRAGPPCSSVDGAPPAGPAGRRPLGVMQLAQRAAAEAALALLDPRRVLETTGQVVQTVRGVASQLDDAGRGGASPLWRARSGRRHLESLRVPLADINEPARDSVVRSTTSSSPAR